MHTSDNPMPIYSQGIDIPANDPNRVDLIQIIIRYYGPFDNDYKLIPPPKLYINGSLKPVIPTLIFPVPGVSGDDGGIMPYWRGSQDGGYDQRSQYYFYRLILNKNEQRVIVNGNFELLSYMSTTLYYYLNGSPAGEQYTYLDKGMFVNSGDKNPYISGNPSVFAYDAPPIIESNTHEKNDQYLKNTQLISKQISDEYINQSGRVELYRADKYSSQTRTLEEVAEDGCSKAYLVTGATNGEPNYNNYDVLLLRIKVPTTFIHNDTPDKVFGDYQCRYISVSSNIQKNDNKDDILDFWTVDPTMLESTKDNDGYAYVFFAPNEYVRTLVAEQNTPERMPPTLTWGNYNGFVLGYPNYAVVIRYRDPNDNWIGNPVNCTCYDNSEDNQPIQNNELGEYTPEIFGDSLVNFQSGKIGLVNSQQNWPSA